MKPKPQSKPKSKARSKAKRNSKTGTSGGKRSKIRNKVYERALFGLQLELIKLQRWIKEAGLKVVVVFEGRDAAGKGGVIKRITE
ncbi:MAG TPA: polyphosphate kinase 2, partial [Paracoccus sp.]|nr:polyphosphate kinase 2 [Paracoccus sp. (in: a-proteobacteria)]